MIYKPVNDMFNFQYAHFKKITKVGRFWHLVSQVLWLATATFVIVESETGSMCNKDEACHYLNT